MRDIKTFFYPLIAFVVLMVMLLFLFLFLPAIGTSTTNMAANATADTGGAVTTKVYAWSWISNPAVVMMLVVLFFVGIGLWHIGGGWIRSRFGQH